MSNINFNIEEAVKMYNSGMSTIYKDSFGMSRKRDLILSKYYK